MVWAAHGLGNGKLAEEDKTSCNKSIHREQTMQAKAWGYAFFLESEGKNAPALLKITDSNQFYSPKNQGSFSDPHQRKETKR
jgi:hypothetical protein